MEVKCVIVSGCQGSDVVSAKICDSDGETLLELPKIHGINLFLFLSDDFHVLYKFIVTEP